MKNKIKKLSIFLFFLICTGLVLAQLIAVMTGGTVTTYVSAENVKFPVYLSNDGTVHGFQAVIEDTSGYLIFKGVEPTERMPDARIVTNPQGGILRIAAVAEQGIAPGDGAIFNVIFDVDENAPAGDVEIVFSDVLNVNISAGVFDTTTVNNLVSVTKQRLIEFLPPLDSFSDFILDEGTVLNVKFLISDESVYVFDENIIVNLYDSNNNLIQDFVYGNEDHNIKLEGSAENYVLSINTIDYGMGIGTYTIEILHSNGQIKTVDV